MAHDEGLSVKEAVHKLQLALLEGIHNEDQLFAAGSLISRSDYEDVVTERSISNLCGYPLCSNPLPSERPWKGRYRISLKEHKVYDLQETFMYCSSGCTVESRAFAGSLQDKRCSVLDSSKINEIMKLFGNLGLEDKGLGKKGDLGLSELQIEEKVDVKTGEMSLDDWIGQSNAIEGYVPLRDRISKDLPLKNHEEGSKSQSFLPRKGRGKAKIVDGMDFTSTIIVGNQFISPKMSSAQRKKSEAKLQESKADQFSILEVSSTSGQNDPETELEEPKGQVGNDVVESQLRIPETTSRTSESDSDGRLTVTESNGEVCVGETVKLKEISLKSSLKPLGAKKLVRSVTWADENQSCTASHGKLYDVQEMGDTQEIAESSSSSNVEDVDSSLRFKSAEACADALRQAAESVARGELDVMDAVSEAGISILSQPQYIDGGDSLKDEAGTSIFPQLQYIEGEDSQKDEDELEPERVPLKWPMKTGTLDFELFDSENSWYDTPPEGFSLSLSSFATMWMSLFGWITSSSLAYIYGREESSEEEFLLVDGREYPRKIVLSDGRSSEIMRTLSGCLTRALPGLVSDLRISIPISVLDKGMDRLLNTMTFIDALPPFRTKQWHVIILLFLDALSVCRIPRLTSYMTSSRMLLHKVLDAAQTSVEEYEVMKDLLIPLGRAPQFSAQCGG